MRGADNSKYGSLMKGLVSQYSMKNDQYPRKMIDAVDVMAKHQFDQAFYNKKKAARCRTNNEDKDKETKPQLAQMKEGYRCHICGKDDHPKKECPKSNLPRKDWFVTKAMNRMQHAQQDEDAGAEEEKDQQDNNAHDESDDESNGWCSFETIVPENGNIGSVGKVTFKQANNVANVETMRDKFLLDTGSTI